MASKKSVRKTSTKKLVKSNTVAKKKTVAKKGKAKSAPKPTATKKKTKAVSGKKKTAVAKKPTKTVKPTAKKKTSAKTPGGKKKVVAKKAVAKKTKAAPKKTGGKTVPKSKAPATKKVATQTKNSSLAKKKIQSPTRKKSVKKSVTSSAPAVQKVRKSQEPLLSPNECTNIGGLFACAIDRRNDPDFSRLRAVLRHLNLSSQEKDNFIRQSQGFMIPKLFAENIQEAKVNLLLADLVKFATKEGNYETYWREEIQQVGFWLGIFPAQFQAIEQQAKR